MYEFAKYIHILCAVVWVGGAVYAQLIALRVAASSDPTELPKLGRNMEWIGTRVFLPASILLFIAGLYMVSQRWEFQQTWISISIVLWLVSAVAGSMYLGPKSKMVANLFETEGPQSVAGRTLLDRLFLISRVELVLFVVVIALMVWKPTLG